MHGSKISTAISFDFPYLAPRPVLLEPFLLFTTNMTTACSARSHLSLYIIQTNSKTIFASPLGTLVSTKQHTICKRHTNRPQRRHVSTKRHASTAIIPEFHEPVAEGISIQSSRLSCLPWSTLLRSYAITGVSSIPFLLKPSIAVLAHLARSKNRFLNPDHNRILHALLKNTFYVQFCAGENQAEAKQTIESLKQLGYSGVILGHAREVVLSKDEIKALETTTNSPEQEALNQKEIKQWRDDTLNTVMLTDKGDYVALKFTGSGRQALQHLKKTMPCASTLRDAIHEICQLAQQRGVSLLFDAEQAELQEGIDNWTMYYMKHYNQDRAVVYGTYQAYAKKTPAVLSQHLAEAQKHGFVLGVKLVRGAYINSDPRELFWDTVEDTHRCYDNLTRCILHRQYGGLLQPAKGASEQFPLVEFILASHNAESVKKAQLIRDQQAQLGEPRIKMAYGQLMGMADHVSCSLVQQANARREYPVTSREVPQAMKYLVWGTMGECMKYLLRRAQENKDAVSRTVDARKALGKEIAIRLGLARA